MSDEIKPRLTDNGIRLFLSAVAEALQYSSPSYDLVDLDQFRNNLDATIGALEILEVVGEVKVTCKDFVAIERLKMELLTFLDDQEI